MPPTGGGGGSGEGGRGRGERAGGGVPHPPACGGGRAPSLVAARPPRRGPRRAGTAGNGLRHANAPAESAAIAPRGQVARRPGPSIAPSGSAYIIDRPRDRETP